jgi:hypothetical protein
MHRRDPVLRTTSLALRCRSARNASRSEFPERHLRRILLGIEDFQAEHRALNLRPILIRRAWIHNLIALALMWSSTQLALAPTIPEAIGAAIS